MFNKAALLSVILPLVAGLTLDQPQKVESAASLTITWTFQPTDPPFSLYLTNDAFHDSFAIANNVQPTQGGITVTLPVLPIRDGYTLKAVNIGNIGDVYSQTSDFPVSANPAASSVPSSSSTGSTSSSTGTGASSSTATTPATATRVTSSSSTGFGVTVTTPSSTSSTGTGTSTGNSAATTSNAAGTPVKFAGNAGAIAAVFFSAVAGAAVFAL